MGWREVFQRAEKEEKGKQVIADKEQVSQFAHFPHSVPVEWREFFEERAAIMEFEGNLSRENAEALATAFVRSKMWIH